VALDVDAAPAGPAGELGVLAGVMSAWVSPFHLTSFSMTTERAGMLMPRASVSVAKTAFTRPLTKSSSTTSFEAREHAGWWAAMPRSRPSSHSK